MRLHWWSLSHEEFLILQERENWCIISKDKANGEMSYSTGVSDLAAMVALAQAQEFLLKAIPSTGKWKTGVAPPTMSKLYGREATQQENTMFDMDKLDKALKKMDPSCE